MTDRSRWVDWAAAAAMLVTVSSLVWSAATITAASANLAGNSANGSNGGNGGNGGSYGGGGGGGGAVLGRHWGGRRYGRQRRRDRV